MRLLFDENLSTLSVDYTRVTLDIDVLDAPAEGLAGKPDSEVRQFAIQSDRILVILDVWAGELGGPRWDGLTSREIPRPTRFALPFR